MKKNLFQSILIFTITSSAAFAQPILTASGISPVIGDTLALHYGSYVSPGNAGANQSWNLSSITNSFTQTYTVGTVASAPSSSSFAASSNLQMNNGTVYQFLNVSSSAYQNSGIIGGGTSIVYSNNEDILHFPFSMNNTFSDPWAATFSSGTNFTRTGTTTVTYDGYGTLILPTGTFSNVARIHIVQVYSDTSSSAALDYINDEYQWYINTHHQPIAGVYAVSTYFMGDLFQADSTGFYSSATALATSLRVFGNDAASLVNSFPNPASEAMQFVFRNGLQIHQIQLFDQYGKLVQSEWADSSISADSPVTVKLDGLTTGIYIAKITASNGVVETQKINVIK